MKKNTLVQLIVIYLGLSSMYLTVYFVLQQAYLMIMAKDGSFAESYNFHYLVSYLVLAVFGIVVILKSGSISKFVSDKAGLDDSLTVFSTPRQLLSILIVVTAIAHLLEHLPTALRDTFDFLTNSFQNGMRDTMPFIGKNSGGITLSLLHILFPCLIIIFARNLTNYFAKNVIQDDEEMVAVQDTVELETTPDDTPGEA